MIEVEIGSKVIRMFQLKNFLTMLPSLIIKLLIRIVK